MKKSLVFVFAAAAFFMIGLPVQGVEGTMTGTVVVSNLSANDSNSKTATTTCPTDYSVISGGLQMVSAQNVLIQNNQSYPDVASNAWIASMQESSTVSGNWQFRVYAVCARYR